MVRVALLRTSTLPVTTYGEFAVHQVVLALMGPLTLVCAAAPNDCDSAHRASSAAPATPLPAPEPPNPRDLKTGRTRSSVSASPRRCTPDVILTMRKSRP